VTLAVLSADRGNALDPPDATGLAADLVTALRAAGASEVERLGDPGELRALSRRAQQANQRVLICADNLVAHASLLRTLATEPGTSPAAAGFHRDGHRSRSAADWRNRHLRLFHEDDAAVLERIRWVRDL